MGSSASDICQRHLQARFASEINGFGKWIFEPVSGANGQSEDEAKLACGFNLALAQAADWFDSATDDAWA